MKISAVVSFHTEDAFIEFEATRDTDPGYGNASRILDVTIRDEQWGEILAEARIDLDDNKDSFAELLKVLE